ncbi:Transcriptional regulator, AraC family [Arcticibacter svalbardensis MN12-7]|uniref:Transcriptional regulator, AraC family n=1 Tax=Arcticibacter svalbardensis MN12-7 TaxID=1150600 RepID=R9GUF4_9SPHI|nr:AraC family transcriptional regulator [Arcticibacter svalbardensis]EOR95356.1 Transcriptional regulator, AraC family [Arcticibacter svalbardensis MN12-7]
MKAPVSIEFPKEMQDNASYTRKRPAGFRYRAGFTEAIFIKSLQAEILHQFYSLKLAYLELFECRVHQPITVKFSTAQPDLFLVYILDGRFTFYTADEKEIVDTAQGQYYADYTPAGTYSVTLAPGNHAILYIVISPEWLDKTRGSFPDLQALMDKVITKSKEIEVLPHRFIDEHIEMLLFKLEKCHAENKMKLELRIYEIIEQLLSAYNASLKLGGKLLSPEQKNNLRIIRSYLTETITNGKTETINSLAERFEINSRTLRRQHRFIYGISLQHFITQKRMQQAHNMLKNDKMTITLVAEQLGFFSPSAFTRQFIRFFGYPPSDLFDR